MTKLKLLGVGMKTTLDKKGKPIQSLQTKVSIDGPPCKQCRKEQRESGSSRCTKCRHLFETQKSNDRRLQEKINRQINK